MTISVSIRTFTLTQIQLGHSYRYGLRDGIVNSRFPVLLLFFIITLFTRLIIFLLMNSFIPISLYVTMEMINIGQSFLVHHDIELYDETIDSPCIVKSSNMCQEPGCISHIFSDKTGTLTRNEMVFVKYIVNNRFYNISSQSPVLNGISDDNEILDLFYTCLATCHTVVREKDGSYRAESPDELALIRGLAFVGVTIEEQLSSTLVLNYRESRRKFDILAINSFNADRKRMSVLLKDNSSGEYIIFCKGADNIMVSHYFENLQLSIYHNKNIDDFIEFLFSF